MKTALKIIGVIIALIVLKFLSIPDPRYGEDGDIIKEVGTPVVEAIMRHINKHKEPVYNDPNATLEIHEYKKMFENIPESLEAFEDMPYKLTYCKEHQEINECTRRKGSYFFKVNDKYFSVQGIMWNTKYMYISINYYNTACSYKIYSEDGKIKEDYLTPVCKISHVNHGWKQ